MDLKLPAQGWVPRWYQLPLVQHMMQDKPGLRAIYCWPRRAGKDLTSINLMGMKALQRKGLYLYIGPFNNQIRRIIWNGQDGDGKRFIDYIPKSLISRKLEQDMTVHLKTGQTIQLLGADDPDKLVGINPVGIVFSEFSLCDPVSWQLTQPILAENKGWAMFNGTPRGKNHFYHMLQRAKANHNWYSDHKTVRDIKHMTPEQLRNARMELNNEAKFQSEYMASFETPVEGSYYGEAISRLYESKQVLPRIQPEPQLPVHTAWDLGVDDATSIWFFQQFRQEVRLLHYYENSGEGLPHYAEYLHQWAARNGLSFGDHYGPHDINVRELGTGVSRIETARKLGMKMLPAKKLSVSDGIEAVRNLLPRCWFSQEGCDLGLERLKGYHKEFDSSRNVFKKQPVHDENSHGADSFRTLAVSLRTRRSEDRKSTPVAYEIEDPDF